MSQPESTFKQDFMASMVVFLVALPLCMGIAIASGVPVAAGLITGIVGGIVVGSIAGSPLQVSGPAAGLTVIVIDIVQKFGLETLGIIVLLAGGLQLLAGIFKLGQWFRAVSPAVIKGMLAGIGVLIFASQFHVMVDDKPKGSGIENLVTIPQAIHKAFVDTSDYDHDSRKFHKYALQEVGELHRQQVEMQERVAELFPHLHDPNIDFSPDHLAAAQAALAQHSETQQSLNTRLAEVTDEIQQEKHKHPEAEEAEKIIAAIVAAKDQNEQALASLDQNDPAAMLAAQDVAVANMEGLLGSLKNHRSAAQLGLLAIATIIVWQFVPGKLKVLPAPLVAVVASTVAAVLFSMPVLYVEVPDQLWEGIHLPSMAVLTEISFLTLLQSAAIIAIVASAETLLCATAVDQMHDGPRTDYDRELSAQGIGNMICGFLGALPMTGVIVRSSANVQAGGKTRLSAILHGIWLLIFVASLGFLLRQIPTAALAAILVYTGFKLVNINAIRELAKYGKSEVFIYFATLATIVCTDLLTGVVVGIVLAAAKLLHSISHLETKLTVDAENRSAVLTVNGSASFLRLPVIAAELEQVPRGTDLHVDFEHLEFIDHACLELLMNWAKQHENTGGRLTIDWESLHARFRSAGRKDVMLSTPSNGAKSAEEAVSLNV